MMITLTEKRLKELEGRYAVYEATIAGLKAKLLEVNTFPKEIKTLQEDLKVAFDNLGISIRELNKNSKLHYEYIQELKKKNEEHASLLKTLASSNTDKDSQIKKHESLINAQAKAIADNFTAHKNVVDAVNSNIKSLSVHGNAISTLGEKVSSHDKKLQIYQDSLGTFAGELTTSQKSQDKKLGDLAHLSTENLDKTHKSIKGEMSNLNGYIGKIHSDLSQNIQALQTGFSSLQAAISNIPEVKDPDLKPVTDKIKTLENAIAELYTLLKHYSTR